MVSISLCKKIVESNRDVKSVVLLFISSNLFLNNVTNGTSKSINHWSTCPLESVSPHSVRSIVKWSTILTVCTGSWWETAALHLLGKLLKWLEICGFFVSPSQSESSFHSLGTCKWKEKINCLINSRRD